MNVVYDFHGVPYESEEECERAERAYFEPLAKEQAASDESVLRFAEQISAIRDADNSVDILRTWTMAELFRSQMAENSHRCGPDGYLKPELDRLTVSVYEGVTRQQGTKLVESESRDVSSSVTP